MYRYSCEWPNVEYVFFLSIFRLPLRIWKILHFVILFCRCESMHLVMQLTGWCGAFLLYIISTRYCFNFLTEYNFKYISPFHGMHCPNHPTYSVDWNFVQPILHFDLLLDGKSFHPTSYEQWTAINAVPLLLFSPHFICIILESFWCMNFGNFVWVVFPTAKISYF